MLLSGILDRKLIYPMVKGSSKNGIIEMLLDEISARYRFRQPKHEIFRAIMAREEQRGTVFGNGIAIPHARFDLFYDLITAIATLETPVVEDGVEIRLVALILTSIASANLYLNFLASLFKLSEKADVFSGILKARTPEEMLSLFERSGIEVKGALTARLKALRDVIIAGLELALEQIVENSNVYKLGSPLKDTKPIVWNQNLALLEEQVVFFLHLNRHLRGFDFGDSGSEEELVSNLLGEVSKYCMDHGYKKICCVTAERRIKQTWELFSRLMHSEI